MDSESNESVLEEYSIIDIQNIVWGVGVLKKIEFILDLIKNMEKKEKYWKKKCSIVLLLIGDFVNGFSLISGDHKNDENDKILIINSLKTFLEKLRRKEKVLKSLEEWKKENLGSLSNRSPIIYPSERQKITLFGTEEELISSFQTKYQSLIDGENILKQIEVLKKSPSYTQQKERKKYGIVDRIGFKDVKISKRRKKRSKKRKKDIFEDQQPSIDEEIKSLEKTCIQKFENVLKTNNFSILRIKACIHLCQFSDFLFYLVHYRGLEEDNVHPFFINAYFKHQSKLENHELSFSLLSIYNHLYPSQEIIKSIDEDNEVQKGQKKYVTTVEILADDEKPNQERVLRLYSEVNDFSKKLNQKQTQNQENLDFINRNSRVVGSLFDSRFKNICDDKSYLENRLLQKYKIMKEYIIYDENSEEYEEDDEFTDDEESEGESDDEDDESTFQFYDILKENDEEEIKKIPVPHYSKFSVQSKGDYLLIRNYPQKPNPISFLMYKGKIAVVLDQNILKPITGSENSMQTLYNDIEFFQFSKNYCQVLCSNGKDLGVVMMFLYKGNLVVPKAMLYMNKVPKSIKVYREDFLMIEGVPFNRGGYFLYNSDDKKYFLQHGNCVSGEAGLLSKLCHVCDDSCSYGASSDSFNTSNIWFYRDRELFLGSKTIFKCQYFEGIKDLETIIDLISVENNILKGRLFQSEGVLSFSQRKRFLQNREKKKIDHAFYRRNLTPFSQFCRPYQSFLITLHFLVRNKNSPFRDLSVDVLEHCILPFFTELEFFEMKNPEIGIMENLWSLTGLEKVRNFFKSLLFKPEIRMENMQSSSLILNKEIVHKYIIYFSLLKYSTVFLNTNLDMKSIFSTVNLGKKTKKIPQTYQNKHEIVWIFLHSSCVRQTCVVLFGNLLISVMKESLECHPRSRKSLFLQKEVIEFLYSLRRRQLGRHHRRRTTLTIDILIESLERIFLEMMEIYSMSTQNQMNDINAEKKYKDLASDDFRFVFPKLNDVRNCMCLILKIICSSKFTPRLMSTLRNICSKMNYSEPHGENNKQLSSDEIVLVSIFFEMIITSLSDRREELIHNRESLGTLQENCDLFEILNHPLVMKSPSVFENVLKIFNQLLAWYPWIHLSEEFENFNIFSSLKEIKNSIFSNEEESDINHFKTLNSECVKRFSVEIPLPFLSGNIKWRKFIRNPPILLELSTKSKWFDNVLTKILPFEKDPEEVFSISLKILDIYKKSFQNASNSLLLFSNQVNYMNKSFYILYSEVENTNKKNREKEEEKEKEEEEKEEGEGFEDIYIDKRRRIECLFSSLSSCLSYIYEYIKLYISEDSKKEEKLKEINLDLCFLNRMPEMFLFQTASAKTTIIRKLEKEVEELSKFWKSFIDFCILNCYEYSCFKEPPPKREENKSLLWRKLWIDIFSTFLIDLLIEFVDKIDINQLPFEMEQPKVEKFSGFSTVEKDNHVLKGGSIKYEILHDILFYFVIQEYFPEEISGTSFQKFCDFHKDMKESNSNLLTLHALEIDSHLLLRILLSQPEISNDHDEEEECEGEESKNNKNKIRNYVRMNAIKITIIHLFHKLNQERNIKVKIYEKLEMEFLKKCDDQSTDDVIFEVDWGGLKMKKENIENYKKRIFSVIDSSKGSFLPLEDNNKLIEEKFAFLDFLSRLEGFELVRKEFSTPKTLELFLSGLEPRKFDIITYLLEKGKLFISKNRHHQNEVQVISGFIFRTIRKYMEMLRSIQFRFVFIDQQDENLKLRSLLNQKNCIVDKHIQLVFEILGMLNTSSSDCSVAPKNPTTLKKKREYKLIIDSLLVFYSRIFPTTKKPIEFHDGNSIEDFQMEDDVSSFVLNNKNYISSVFDGMYMWIKDYFEFYDSLIYGSFYRSLPALLKQLLFVNFSNSLKLDIDWKIIMKLLVHWGIYSSRKKMSFPIPIQLKKKHKQSFTLLIEDINENVENIRKKTNQCTDNSTQEVNSHIVVGYDCGNYFWNHHLIIFLLKNIFHFFGPKEDDEDLEEKYQIEGRGEEERREGLKCLDALTTCFSFFFKEYSDINYVITGNFGKIGNIDYDVGFQKFLKVRKEEEFTDPITSYRKPVKSYWKLSIFLERIIIDIVNHCSSIEEFDQILGINSFIDCGKRVNAGEIIIKKMKSFKEKSKWEEKILSEFSEKKQIKINTLKKKEEEKKKNRSFWTQPLDESSFGMTFEGRVGNEEHEEEKVLIKKIKKEHEKEEGENEFVFKKIKKNKEEMFSMNNKNNDEDKVQNVFDFEEIFGDNGSSEKPKEIQNNSESKSDVFSFDDSFNFSDGEVEKESEFSVSNLDKGKEFEDDGSFLFSFSDNHESKEVKKEDRKSPSGDDGVFNFEI